MTQETKGHGPSCWWRLEAHNGELYAHNGAVRPDGFPVGPSVVQLHIDLRAVAEPRDAEARELSARPGPLVPLQSGLRGRQVQCAR